MEHIGASPVNAGRDLTHFRRFKVDSSPVSPLEKNTEEDICEWSGPEMLEDEDELPPMCSNPATRVVWGQARRGPPL